MYFIVTYLYRKCKVFNYNTQDVIKCNLYIQDVIKCRNVTYLYIQDVEYGCSTSGAS